MSSVINKIKSKVSSNDSSDSSNSEPSFSIQPHPAQTNDPADLQPQQPGGGLATSNPMAAHHARDPHVPSTEVQAGLQQPLEREELHARGAELNK